MKRPMPAHARYWKRSCIAEAFCINLERRTDRWIDAQQAFEGLEPGIRMHRFNAGRQLSSHQHVISAQSVTTIMTFVPFYTALFSPGCS